MAQPFPKSTSARTGTCRKGRPGAPVSADRVSTMQARVSESSPRRPRVLVLDDEPSICALIAEYLEDEGYEVVTALRPLEALETFLAGQFDVVVTDRDMPDLSGDQVSALVKASSPGTPVIMVTSHGARMERDGECPRQVDACIGKPFDPQRLLEAVRKVLERGVQPDSASRRS